MIVTKYKDFAIFYTDGSKNEENKTGFAFYTPSLNKTINCKCNKINTIFDVEAAAIYNSLIFAKASKLKKILIATDSLSVLEALDNLSFNKILLGSIIPKIKATIFKLEKENSHEVSLIWIPSHKGIQGNERVDSAAKNALTLEKEIPKIYNLKSLKKFFQNNSYKESNDEIKKNFQIKGIRYWNLCEQDSKDVWFSKKPYNTLNRKQISLINRIRSFHVPLAQHLVEKNILTDPACPCGYESQSLNHVFYDCKNTEDRRKKLIENLAKHKIIFPIDFHCLSFTKNMEILRCICTFAENINIKI